MRIVWPFERDNLINNRSLAYYRNRREKKERRKKWSINSWPMERTRIILIQVISSVPLATWSFFLVFWSKLHSEHCEKRPKWGCEPWNNWCWNGYYFLLVQEFPSKNFNFIKLKVVWYTSTNCWRKRKERMSARSQLACGRCLWIRSHIFFVRFTHKSRYDCGTFNCFLWLLRARSNLWHCRAAFY